MTQYKIDPEPGVIHFLTLTVVKWLDIFTKSEYFQIIIDSLKYCRQYKGLLIQAYVIMINHLHLIVSSARDCKSLVTVGDKTMVGNKTLEGICNPDQHKISNKILEGICNSKQYKIGDKTMVGNKTLEGICNPDQRCQNIPILSAIIRDFKKYTAKKIYQQLKQDNRHYLSQILKIYKSDKNKDFQLWQHDNHAIIIESEKFLDQRIDYIHNNPVEKQYVTKPEDWLYSSARGN